MVKRRKYGDAWKDVQIDAEQNDAVFDRFFKRTPAPPEEPPAAEAVQPAAAESLFRTPPAPEPPLATVPPLERAKVRPRPSAAVEKIEKPLRAVVAGGDVSWVDDLKKQYRLSKGEAEILKQLLQKVEGEGEPECYAKVPELADACSMTHRGCQFALKNLQARGFIVRVKDYDPADRLGIKFQITIPAV